MTPADLRKMIESKATAPVVVDWLWLDLELLAPETPNAETSAKVQQKLDAWAYEFASAGGQIGWEQFRRLNEMSRAAFIKAGRQVRRELAAEIAAASVAAQTHEPEITTTNGEGPKFGTSSDYDGNAVRKDLGIPPGMILPDPDADPEPTVEDFTPIGTESNASGPAAKAAAEPAVVGATLESALDYAERMLRQG